MGVIIKFLTVGTFAVILYFLIDYIVLDLQNVFKINTLMPNVKYVLCKLGIFDAINIFFSLQVASWFTNKLLKYISG